MVGLIKTTALAVTGSCLHQRGRGEQGDAKLDGQVPRKQVLPEPRVLIGKFGRALLIALKRFSGAAQPKMFLGKFVVMSGNTGGQTFLTWWGHSGF